MTQGPVSAAEAQSNTSPTATTLVVVVPRAMTPGPVSAVEARSDTSPTATTLVAVVP